MSGEVLQEDSTDNMIWSVAQTIETISEFATLEPGDMIATGTLEGVGFARTPPRWLLPGDTMEVAIEQIGICTNSIVGEDS